MLYQAKLIKINLDNFAELKREGISLTIILFLWLLREQFIFSSTHFDTFLTF